jgi:hypothetical protein
MLVCFDEIQHRSVLSSSQARVYGKDMQQLSRTMRHKKKLISKSGSL